MADAEGDKLYKAEYAKSGRASCKKCKENIAKDSLRMAIMVQVTSSGSFTLKKPANIASLTCDATKELAF